MEELVAGRLLGQPEIIWDALGRVDKAELGAEEDEQCENEERVIQLPVTARAPPDKITKPKSCQDKQLEKEHAGRGIIDMPDAVNYRDFFNHFRRKDAKDQ